MQNKIIQLFVIILIVNIISGVNTKQLQAEELKDYNYYLSQYYKKECKVIKEWEEQSNYKEILKVKKDYENGAVSYVAFIVADCWVWEPYEKYNLEIFFNDKDILMLKETSKDNISIDYIATYFAAYSYTSGCTVWDLIKGWYNYTYPDSEDLKQRVLAKIDNPYFFDELEAETAKFQFREGIYGCDYSRYYKPDV